MNTIQLNREQHLKLIESAWKKKYPTTKLFHSSGFGLKFSYVDGPPVKEADAFIRGFNTRAFDSYCDMWYGKPFDYEGVTYSGGYGIVSIYREYSATILSARCRELMNQHSLTDADQKLSNGNSVNYQARQDLEERDLQYVVAIASSGPISFAELKRRLDVGVVLDATFYNPDGSESRVRSGCAILVKQSNAIALQREPGSKEKTWLYWPPARCVLIHSGTSFTVLRSDGSVVARYEIVQQPAMTAAA